MLSQMCGPLSKCRGVGEVVEEEGLTYAFAGTLEVAPFPPPRTLTEGVACFSMQSLRLREAADSDERSSFFFARSAGLRPADIKGEGSLSHWDEVTGCHWVPWNPVTMVVARTGRFQSLTTQSARTCLTRRVQRVCSFPDATCGSGSLFA